MYQKIKYFFTLPTAGGIILMLSAVLGLIIANSPLSDLYFSTLGSYIGGLSVLHWINDALMAIFFLYVGLELKREFISGELATNAQRILPGLAAFAGLAVPAVIYFLLNKGDSEAIGGWAIPTATDIAFALGIVALLGSRVPVSLKIFLTALAIIDDLAAILIIALFYSNNLNLIYLLGALVVLILLIVLNRRKETRAIFYIIPGIILWFFVLKSGIHATLAGVVLAMTIPLNGVKANKKGETPLLAWEHGLSDWVSFLIIPLFGLANAGVSFAGLELSMLTHPIVLGVALGLFFGKQIGVFGMVYLGEKLGVFKRPTGATWIQVYGVALLCGIGFTMSLFISMLAFVSPELQDLSKIGVFIGSILSGVLGYIVLYMNGHKNAQ
ncbi:Na+/H+ antiporter NhaA [Ignatzschineria ureiclastica]|uniref:Na(+)/H(+) antiporter NhaA n=1 Tax=Ignatzschineria ureiclastica TaxID=472582 RepID=A0A2U2ADX4_9GAMM|nr:Na+/H+ antiporter NhaA [Ignatzschineria ureiclastica]PWD80862.1 Na+/H+ antiporter NhaA [Ignatzschineria ureiclastica]GGZ94285.1 Na(+)/H(+) antiporter NhaA [Ignatzschineria ureiclastica]